MRFTSLIGVSILGICTQSSLPVVADETGGLEHLLGVIEQQHRQLEAQQAQIELQRQTLAALRRDVEALRASPSSAPSPAGARKPLTPVRSTPESIGSPLMAKAGVPSTPLPGRLRRVIERALVAEQRTGLAPSGCPARICK